MPNVNTLLRDHVVLKYEMPDPLFLNGYVAKLQEPDQLHWFLCQHRGQEIPRYELLGKMTRDFVAAIERYAAEHRVPMLHFQKGQRKEAVALRYFQAAERQHRYGVVLIGVSQEKANVFRPPAKGQRQVGRFAAHRNAAFVKYFYVYIRDRDFGPGFIRFCSYAPFSLRICLNGHQWLAQHLRISGHDLQQLDNGIAWVDDPEALRRLCRRFGAAHIQRFFDRWISFLPNPFSSQDRAAGYTYQLSILQLEISDTRVFDRPLHGRQFFEEVIREHLDLGRPDQIQLVFGGGRKRSWRQPPRTRVFADGIHPSLPVGYRNTKVKQYSVTELRAAGSRSQSNNSVRGRLPHWSVSGKDRGIRLYADRAPSSTVAWRTRGGFSPAQRSKRRVRRTRPEGATTTSGVEAPNEGPVYSEREASQDGKERSTMN